ncbi:ChbG/HpnK family deacetylase [Roseobacter sinensis]|uniref:ChbG/HpnK family deacetylase n=1 Tax=Roseobacter sinensis TaxID=2931391 RepID=A0ABT3BJA2_9RHOB|nr:ChbG/HpnK family deacetylase [Roseobacter sp. WL0113]MCV3273658.1 ChbG/HpnK family deacetylase [Roseobacter sp. WL0113]
MGQDIRLLVRADDAGSTWASNLGCLRACTDGIARSVEVMMPCPWITHAAKLFRAHPQIDIGLHLTLTSEWDAVKWRPLTPAPTLVDETGHFQPLLTLRAGDTRRSLAENAWDIDELVGELHAQIAQGVTMFPQASHVSSHMIRHLRDLDPRLGEIIAALCTKFGLADDAFGYGLPRIAGYPAQPRVTASRVAAFIETLRKLTPGTYIFIDHPAAESTEMTDVGHPGYEDVQADRLTCLETLTHPELRATVEQLGIELICYRDL